MSDADTRQATPDHSYIHRAYVLGCGGEHHIPDARLHTVLPLGEGPTWARPIVQTALKVGDNVAMLTLLNRSGLPAVFVVLGACGPADPVPQEAERHHGAVRVVREVAALEPELPLGAYTSFFSVASDGRFFVTDIDRARVVAYAPDGTVASVLGRSGTGPGEFQLPGITYPMGDSLLLVGDMNARSLVGIEPETGELRRTIRMSGFRDWSADWTFIGDTAVFAALDARGVIARWPLSADSAFAFGALPPEYLTGRPRGLIRRYGRIGIASTPSGLVAHLPTEDGVRRINGEGEVGPLIPLPVRSRRGIPPELHALKISTSRERTEVFPNASLNVGLATRSDGLLIAYHWEYDRDPRQDERDPDAGNVLTDIRVYVSLLTPALDSACVDIRLPITTDIPPFPVTRGDTTFLFTRAVDATTDDVASTLVAFHVDPGACTWEALGEAGP